MRVSRSTQIKKLAAAVALAAYFALACGGPSKPANPSAPLPIRIGYTPGSLTRLYTAMSLKLFDAHGLQAELTQFQSCAASAAAFKSGQIDIAFAGVPGLVTARLRSDAQVFLVEATDRGAFLVAQSGGTIKSPKDLSGKTVGTAKGTGAHVGLLLALDAYGVRRSTVNIVDLGPNVWVSAFQSRQVDALAAFGLASYELMATGAKPIANLTDYIPAPIMRMGRTQFLSSQDGAKAAGRFISAMYEAGKRFKPNESKIITYMSHQNGGISESIIKREVADLTNVGYADELKSDYQWSLVNPDAGLQSLIDKYVRILVQVGWYTTAPDFTNAYNPQPLKDVKSQLG
jgi:ABC-type nitrate/sulfonate/bicarbonate transport system substrate-binding protein